MKKKYPKNSQKHTSNRCLAGSSMKDEMSYTALSSTTS